MALFLSVLGLVLIIEGIPYFAFPEKVRALLSRLPLMPTSRLRFFGITAILIGLMLVYISRRMPGSG